MYIDEKDKLLELSSLAKDIVFNYFKDILKKNNDSTKIEKLKSHLDSYKIIKANDNSNAHAKCNNSDKTIKIFQSFTYEEYHLQLFVLVHEYMHAVSSFVTELSMPAVIEEGFAESLAEIALNKYYKNINIELDDTSYKPCAELIKLLLANLEKNGQDLELIYNYYFKHKKDFCNFFEENFGEFARKFLVLIDYIDPMIDESTSLSVRRDIDSVLSKTIKPILKLDIDKSIEKCGKKESDYYYHNLLMERYLFQELQKKYMDVISFNKFLDLLKKFKSISRSRHFECPELDGLLKVFYFPNMAEFQEVLKYVKVLPQDIGIDLLEKSLSNNNDKMETILSYSSIIRDFDKISYNYLKYYNSKGKKLVKGEFLLKVLNCEQKYDSFYYYELLTNSKNDLNEVEKEKMVSLMINFLENNVLETDQEYTLKVISLLPKYAKKFDIKAIKFIQICKLINLEIMQIVQTGNVRINSFNTDTLELDINFDDLSTIDAIYKLVQRKDIIYLKKYLIKGLKKMKEKLPKGQNGFDKI